MKRHALIEINLEKHCFLTRYKEFLYVGGMPEAVATYVRTVRTNFFNNFDIF